MRQLEIDSQTNLSHILSELKTTDENGLELNVVPNETTVLDNPIHRLIIEKAAKDFNKEVVFPASPIEDAPEVESDDLGFVEGEDIVAKTPIEEVHKMIQPAAVISKEVLAKKKKFTLPKFLKNKLVLLGIGVFALIIAFGLGIYFLPSAKIELVLSSETKDSQITLTGDTTQKEVDIKNKIVPMKAIEVSKEGDDEQTTTGKKTVGTVAKGRVTITNRSVEKTFIAGTILTPVATSSATFKLDNDVTIPASQWPLGSDGTIGVNVTATAAGTAGNLAANTSFKVGSASTIEISAKNDLALSGGSSKQVTVASADDREVLKKQIVDKLTADAKKDTEKKTKDSIVPDEGSIVEVVKEEYEPKDINAEAEKLKATISIKVKTFVFDRNDLTKVFVESLEKSAKGFSVDKEASKITLQQTEKTSETVAKFIGKIKAVLHPEINKKEITRQTTGKSLNDVDSYLDSSGNISSYKVITFPGFFKFMPFNQSKIEVRLKND